MKVPSFDNDTRIALRPEGKRHQNIRYYLIKSIWLEATWEGELPGCLWLAGWKRANVKQIFS